MNRVILVGRLGRDAEVRYTQSATPVANLNLATDESYKDKDSGEKAEKAEWHKIVAWNKLGELAGQYLGKGSQVLVEGSIQTNKWTDQEGNEKETKEIKAQKLEFLQTKSPGENSGDSGGSTPPPTGGGGNVEDAPF